jgi:putative heme-binding domain-containing protein
VKGGMTMWIRRWSAHLIGLALAAGTACAQGYSAADVQTGKQLYGVNCTNCHGPKGDFVAGVDLGHFKLRRASTDNEVVAIMLQGIRDTPMPPANLSDRQAHQIVAYLRSMSESKESGRASVAQLAHGKSLFETKGCLSCHRVSDRGSRVGPDLTNIGAIRNRPEIEKSIVDPNAEVLAENRFVRIVTRDGVTITGRILNQDTFSVQLIDNKEKLVSLQKSDLREFQFLPASPMPSFRDKLTGEELSDLTSYLASLKGM